MLYLELSIILVQFRNLDNASQGKVGLFLERP